MSIASLSLTFVQYNSTADFARTQVAAPPLRAPGAATPAPAPAAAAPTSCQHTCDSPRRSPLYRALMDALGSLVPSTPSAPAGSPVAATAPPAPATAPAAAPAPTPATDAASAASPPDLEEAVMNFARALMQAVRGSDRGDDDRERDGRHRHAHHEHGHHHRHHDHGRRAWGDPAQRIDALGARWGASPSPRPNTAPALPLDPVPTTPPIALTDVTLDPVVATDLSAANAAPTPLPAPSSDTVAPRRDRYGLLDAFSALHRALGLPVVEGRDGLETQLGAFLRILADRLRGGDADSAAATTQPGALLNVTA